MRKTIVSASVLALIVLSACSNDSANTDAARDNPPMLPDNTTPATPASAAMSLGDFATNLAASDIFELESSMLVLQKSQTAEVKKFAQMMIDAHRQSSAKLKKIAAESKPPLTLPAQLPADRQAKIDTLSSAKADTIDGFYMTNQIEAHQATLAMLESYAANGQDSALKQLATSLAPVVAGHLDMARRMKMPTAGKI